MRLITTEPEAQSHKLGDLEETEATGSFLLN